MRDEGKEGKTSAVVGVGVGWGGVCWWRGWGWGWGWGWVVWVSCLRFNYMSVFPIYPVSPLYPVPPNKLGLPWEKM